MHFGRRFRPPLGLEQDHGSLYGPYSEAVTFANAQGLTMSAILEVDGGWAGTNPATTQTILFHSIQANGVTRLPN